jgi:hypothetical protein
MLLKNISYNNLVVLDWMNMIVVKLGLRRDTKNVRSVTKHKKNGQYYHLVTFSLYHQYDQLNFCYIY